MDEEVDLKLTKRDADYLTEMLEGNGRDYKPSEPEHRILVALLLATTGCPF
jgi:hypothetical protein